MIQSSRRNCLSLAFAAIVVFALFLAVPSAFAHTHPEAMMPAADSTVTSPSVVMMHFSGAIEPKFSHLTVTDATGHVVNKDSSAVGGDAKSMTLAMPTLHPGVYIVNWVAVSVDSHRSQGEYKFTVK
ncbi:copper resistance protein CopC [Granulicella sp. dw_53]|uniref:copper resistance CopC family protein n=1 Tax=Granulicella sp. dw_53 TaxID=2719792 RepID=UPI001BD5DF59|nr:copper resistance protein CopC [Granulicella sp. dw_53]